MRLFDIGATDDPAPITSRVVTVPNAISLTRILALPLLYLDLATGRLGRALLLVVVFSATDWLDGYLARRLGQVSRIGQLLDPVADRLLFAAVGIGSIVGGLLPWWVVAAILVRDAAVLVVGAALLGSGSGVPPVTRLGKAATFGLMAAFPLLITAALAGGGPGAPQPAIARLAWTVLIVSLVLYWAAAVDYARLVGRRAVRDAGDGDARSQT
jgi:cardiolipin synthase (CMP-forming)